MKCLAAQNLLFCLCAMTLLSGCSSGAFYKSLEQFDTTEPPPSNRQHTFEDKLILIQTRSVLDQIALINNFQHDPSNSEQIKSRKRELMNQLIEKEEMLLTCSRYHKDKDLSISLECARMAHKIYPSNASKEALKDIQKLVADRARKKQITNTANKKRKRDLLMAQAWEQYDQSSYSATIKTLNQVLTIEPRDKEAKQLLSKLKPIQKKHVAELISMGDRLYRDEKIEQALAVWKAAKNLAMNDKELAGKIDRAEKVLGSVNKIKGLPLQTQE